MTVAALGSDKPECRCSKSRSQILHLWLVLHHASRRTTSHLWTRRPSSPDRQAHDRSSYRCPTLRMQALIVAADSRRQLAKGKERDSLAESCAKRAKS